MCGTVSSEIFYSNNVQKKDNLEDVCSDKRIILKWCLNKQDVRMCNNLCGSAYGPGSGSREHCNKWK